MTTAAALLLALAALAARPATPVQSGEDPARAELLALFEGRQAEALADVWREHPASILTAIDADLEGALALWERAPEAPDREQIALLHERALWGARVASEATGNPVFEDYAASFVGWDAEQKRSFRAGQAAHGRARAALREGDVEAALAAARECVERAEPLGDWWGTAMGLAAEGAALARADDAAGAAAALARARQIYHDLGLAGAESRTAADLARHLVASGPPARARAALAHARRLAAALGDEAGRAELEELGARLGQRAR